MYGCIVFVRCVFYCVMYSTLYSVLYSMLYSVLYSVLYSGVVHAVWCVLAAVPMCLLLPSTTGEYHAVASG